MYVCPFRPDPDAPIPRGNGSIIHAPRHDSWTRVTSYPGSSAEGLRTTCSTSARHCPFDDRPPPKGWEGEQQQQQRRRSYSVRTKRTRYCIRWRRPSYLPRFLLACATGINASLPWRSPCVRGPASTERLGGRQRGAAARTAAPRVCPPSLRQAADVLNLLLLAAARGSCSARVRAGPSGPSAGWAGGYF